MVYVLYNGFFLYHNNLQINVKKFINHFPIPPLMSQFIHTIPNKIVDEVHALITKKALYYSELLDKIEIENPYIRNYMRTQSKIVGFTQNEFDSGLIVYGSIDEIIKIPQVYPEDITQACSEIGEKGENLQEYLIRILHKVNDENKYLFEKTTPIFEEYAGLMLTFTIYNLIDIRLEKNFHERANALKN